MTFRTEVVSGIRWSSISQYGQQGLLLGTTAVLSRLLQPSDFGLLSMALVVTRLPLMFKDLGTASGVIQHNSPSEALLSSVFWLNVIFGLIICLVVCVAAPFVADFYGEPSLAPLLRALSSIFIFWGPRSLLQALMERELQFVAVARAELIGVAAATSMALALGFQGRGVWSLVALHIVSPAVACGVIWTTSRWRPRVHLDWSALRVLARYSGSLTGFNILNFLSRNADYVLIGRFLGAEALGYYTLAYTLMLLPLKSVSGVIGRGILPAFVKMRREPALFQDEFLKIASLTAAVTFPMMCGLMALCSLVIIVVFGEKWRPAVPLVMILAPVGMVQSILTFNGIIYQASGRTDRQFWMEAVLAPLVITSFWVGLPWGVVGVAAAYSVMSLALAVPSALVAYDIIGLPLAEMGKVLARPLASGLIVAGALVMLTKAIPTSTAPGIILIAAAPVAAIIYFWTARRLLTPELARVHALLRP